MSYNNPMPVMFFTPIVCNISAIANGVTTVVTTAINNLFVVGSQVMFQIPQQYGMRQLDQVKGYVIAQSPTSITVNINSSNFDTFSVPASSPPTVIEPAQVIPVGTANSGYLCPGGIQPQFMTPPGAFADIT